MKGLKQADWIAVAKEFLAELPDDELRETTSYKVEWGFRLTRLYAATDLLIAEKLKRGMICLTDLAPDERRRLIDPANLDLHAIAVAPIMKPGEIYLPAGKLTVAETKAREQAQIERLA